MEIKSVDAGNGWNWFVSGWAIFMKKPGIWIGLVLVFVLVNIILTFIPLLGSIVLAVITPALMAGLVYAAQQSAEADGPQIGHLFRGLSDPEKRNPMLVLGALYLAGMMVAMLGGLGMMGGGMMMAGVGSGAGGEMDVMPEVVGASGLLGMAFMLLVTLAMVALFIYAAPLVMFTDTRPIDAIKGSFSGSLKNIVPMLVASLVYLVLGIIATIPLGLGWLILGPVTAGAVYQSYSDIFG